jgi:predicted nuclease with RNAse H fold
MSRPRVAVGIDVGGTRKGFHAVALHDGRRLKTFAAPDPESIALWCREVDAWAVGIDAPCRWSITGRARPAERELAVERIHCFATPSRRTAERRKFYQWMLNGAALYQAIERNYPLFDGRSTSAFGRVCFETFPQAVACALAGKTVRASEKRIVRRELLQQAGIDTTSLTNIDTIDAALCALTANYLLTGSTKAYGDVAEGLIIVPVI